MQVRCATGVSWSARRKSADHITSNGFSGEKNARQRIISRMCSHAWYLRNACRSTFWCGHASGLVFFPGRKPGERAAEPPEFSVQDCRRRGSIFLVLPTREWWYWCARAAGCQRGRAAP